MRARRARIDRVTKETRIRLSLVIDGRGEGRVDTGIPFFDHMLTLFAKHAVVDLELRCRGDLEVDAHHTVEDCAICLGQALDQALGDKKGIVRFGHAYAPLDEALARAVVDLSGRPAAVVNLGLQTAKIGQIASQNLSHAIESIAAAARITIHVDVKIGRASCRERV